MTSTSSPTFHALETHGISLSNDTWYLIIAWEQKYLFNFKTLSDIWDHPVGPESVELWRVGTVLMVWRHAGRVLCIKMAKVRTASALKYDFKPRSHSTPCLNHVQKSYEILVDVVVSGNFWSIMVWPCFVRGMAFGGCSTVEALPRHD